MDGWCEVLRAVADALGVERYALLGHSLGGLGWLMLSSIRFERIAEGNARLIPRSDTLIFEDGGHRRQRHHAEAIAAAMRWIF